MTLLGLRLALAGGRRAVATAALTIAAVAIGTTLLLLALTVAPAMQARADRTAWTQAGFGDSQTLTVPLDSPQPHTTVSSGTDTYGDLTIEVVDLGASGPGAPVPDGFVALPRAGDVLVSPALRRLLNSAAELQGRYGRVVGTLGDAALGGPDDLMAARGVPVQVGALQGIAVAAFPSEGQVLQLTGVVRLLLLLGAVAMLAPVALLVALSTRLSATTRERRLAALRLVGATNKQVAKLAAAESLLAGLGGVLAGAVLFLAVRPAATHVTYDGGRWFTADLNPGLPAFAAVLVVVPLVAAAATQFTLARVKHSPLGVARRATPKPVRVWRLLPLAVAVPVLGLALPGGGATGHGRLVLTAFSVLLVTLLYAGPWLTHAVGVALAHSNGASRVLAGRRLADDPRAGFRSIAGVVLAILITTMFAATTPAAAESLRDNRVTGQQDGTAQASIYAATPTASAGLLRDVAAVQGVTAAALVYTGLVQDQSNPANVWIGDCDKIALATKLAALPCGQAPVLVAENRARIVPPPGGTIKVDNVVPAQLVVPGQARQPDAVSTLDLQLTTTARMPAQSGVDVPGLIVSPASVAPQLDKLRPTLLVLSYDKQAALERVRTLVLQQVPAGSVNTRASTYNGYSSDVRRLYRVLTIATLGTFGVAALGLLVAVAVGLLERRRPFALLRASGTPLHTLRRTAFLEASAPLTALSLLAAGLGTLVGHWTVTAGTAGQSQQLPWVGLLAPTAAGLAIALLVLSCAMPLVRRVTETNETRFE